jgi:EAL domain-containing protein (putative c-di-GMP-specific phosphodiesterase class I)
MTITTVASVAQATLISPSLTLKKIKRSTHQVNGEVLSKFENITLTSYFQPLYSIDHQKVIGYEALIRGKDNNGNNVTPEVIFDKPRDEMSSVYLDRLCCYTHVANAHKLKDQDKWLFINASSLACEKSRKYGDFFSDLLKYFNIPAERVVVEIIEDHCSNNAKLLETCNYYKSMGCLIAIDDFGAGYSNFERIWNLRPDIVKLDRSIILRAIQSNHTKNILTSIVQVLHESGCLVVIEGIETEEQALIATDSNADFVQGFYFSKPQPASFIQTGIKPLFAYLMTQTVAIERSQLHQDLYWSSTYGEVFLKAAMIIKAGKSIKSIIKLLMNLKKVTRCFLVDNQGQQLGESYIVDQGKLNPDGQFYQLQLGENANWYRKHYIRNALRQPHQMHISPPYQSITGDGLCITTSMCFDTDKGQKILCMDILAEHSD